MSLTVADPKSLQIKVEFARVTIYIIGNIRDVSPSILLKLVRHVKTAKIYHSDTFSRQVELFAFQLRENFKELLEESKELSRELYFILKIGESTPVTRPHK